MKQKYYIRYVICLIVAIGLFVACTHDYMEDSPRGNENNGFSLAEAKSFFEKNYLSKSTRSSGESKPTGLAVGDYVPQWETAQNNSQGNMAGIEVMIQAQYKIKVAKSEFKSGKASAYMVPAWQKVVFIKDRNKARVCGYLVTLIPEKEYYLDHKNDAGKTYQLYRRNNSFSGLLILSRLDDNATVIEVHKVKAGKHTAKASVFDRRFEGSENVLRIKKALSSIALSRNRAIQTRSGEGYDVDGGWGDPVDIFPDDNYNPWDGDDDDDPGIFDPGIDWGDDDDFEIDESDGSGDNGPKEDEPKEDPKEDPKPCNDEDNNKANPLTNMKLQPPSASNIKGATFGLVRKNSDGTFKSHTGIDLAAPVGTPVYAMFDGAINRLVDSQPNRVGNTSAYPDDYSGDKNAAGNRIYVSSTVDGETILIGYWHLEAGNAVAINPRTGKKFKTGDSVNQGDIIGYTGLTGNANVYNKPHLHLGVKKNSSWINPEDYLNATIKTDTTKVSTPCDDN